ncbi:hypothetical protein F01_360032 [Burkholderia cenocepacia]|nr:hypothetical protein F01_360032 [Burkholderia cenocepacia]
MVGADRRRLRGRRVGHRFHREKGRRGRSGRRRLGRDRRDLARDAIRHARDLRRSAVGVRRVPLLRHAQAAADPLLRPPPERRARHHGRRPGRRVHDAARDRAVALRRRLTDFPTPVSRRACQPIPSSISLRSAQATSYVTSTSRSPPPNPAPAG